MKFNDYNYNRPNYEKYKIELTNLVNEFKNSKSFEECDEKFNKINNLRKRISTLELIASVRHDINTKDVFYDEESNYWNKYKPLYTEVDNDYFKILVAFKFRKEFEEKYGKQMFKILDLKLKAFSPEIIEEIQLENKLISEYTNLVSTAKINFCGKEMNLSGLGKYKESKDREIRKAANLAYSKFFADNEDEFDRIYDELVKIRDKMAKKMGYKNYVELGYIIRNRTDFNAEMVNVFRKQVKEYIVPIVAKLVKRQEKRLNLENLEYYDESIEFLSGNPELKVDSKGIIEGAIKMYSELSEETNKFFKHMVDNELMNLETKQYKSLGGYCEYFFDYDTPFIFGNFNGTSSDVKVLTHEIGHALQAYLSGDVPMVEIIWPTYEAAEIHSMSMEFLTWPWLENFFLEDTDKYKFIHLSETIRLIPYAVAVDTFQNYVYENPNITPNDRKAIWRKIEKEYQPYRNYGSDEFLERGGYWFKITHIFQSPFYFIDYALAQICAFQFWEKYNENRSECWNDYMNICKVGGTESFLNIVKLANLQSPFEEGSIYSVINKVEKWLDSINDRDI